MILSDLSKIIEEAVVHVSSVHIIKTKKSVTGIELTIKEGFLKFKMVIDPYEKPFYRCPCHAYHLTTKKMQYPVCYHLFIAIHKLFSWNLTPYNQILYMYPFYDWTKLMKPSDVLDLDSKPDPSIKLKLKINNNMSLLDLKNYENHILNEFSCPICLDSLNQRQVLTQCGNCLKILHQKCWSNWVAKHKKNDRKGIVCVYCQK